MASNLNFTVGNFEKVNNPGGWFVGNFVPKNVLENDNNIEISVKRLPKGWGKKNEHPLHFHEIAKEFGIVTKGSAKVKFDGKNLSISKGDYYILNPGCQEKFLEITEEMELITIKIPSVQNDKIVVGD